MGNFATAYYRICVWLIRMLYVNLLWVLFNLFGLVVLGAMPSTAAMFAVVRKWVLGEKDIPIFRTFWESFRKEFIKANLLGYLLAAIGYVMYLDLQFLRQQEGFFYQVLSYCILGLFFLYIIVLLYVFPLFSHFEMKTVQYLKWAFIVGLTHPILTIMMAASVAAVYCITSMIIPGLVFFFLGSGSAFVLMWGVSRTFSKFPIRQEETT